jgi:NADH-quinone oxidoreductase subunit A
VPVQIRPSAKNQGSIEIMIATAGYEFILIFLALALFISIAALSLGALFSVYKPNPAKNDAYECGFPAFEEARQPFDVKFYLVAILFIIFDLETAFLFPWAVVVRKIGIIGLLNMAFFIGILLVGFYYEWRKGALEW